MKPRTLLLVLIAVLVLASTAYAVRQRGGGLLMEWFSSLHGGAPRGH